LTGLLNTARLTNKSEKIIFSKYDDGSTNEQTDRQRGSWIVKWIDRQPVGWTDGQTERQKDRKIER
jgi:hypothetical protein